MAVGPKTFVPYTERATLFLHSSLWSLFLPPSPHPLPPALRRSYLAQPVLWRQGGTVAYSSSLATSSNMTGSSHSLDPRPLLDLHLYCSSAPACLLQLYNTSLARSQEHEAFGLVAGQDLVLLGAWLEDLRAVGYASQPVRQTKQFAYLNMGGRLARGSSPRLTRGNGSHIADFFSLSFFSPTGDVYFPDSTWQQVHQYIGC